MSSSYIVPDRVEKNDRVTQETEYNYNNNNNNNNNLNLNQQLHSIDDLPKFLRNAIYMSPTRWKKTFVFLELSGCLGLMGTSFSYITSSVTIGVAVALYFTAASCCQILSPDFTKGVFLNVLLKDSKTAKKMNNELFNMLVSNLVFNFIIMIPLLLYFFTIPFANSKMMGSTTYVTTIILASLGSLCGIVSCFFILSAQLPERVSLVHIDKIKMYIEKIRHTILDHNPEDGISLFKKLSKEQKIVENWIMAINKGISLYNTLFISISLANCALFLLIAAGGFGIGATITFSLFALFMWYFFCTSLYAVSKANLVWEQQKIALLNDPEVISSVLLKLKFPTESFESWLTLHNINASRAFGTKITFEKMKQASGILTTVFGTVFYLLLRDEFHR